MNISTTVSQNNSTSRQTDPAETRRLAHYEAIQTCYREWLALRGSSDGGQPDDDYSDKAGDRIDDLERQICAMPAGAPYQVYLKFEILEHSMQAEFEAGPFIDRRHVLMLAGIKADVVRYFEHDLRRYEAP